MKTEREKLPWTRQLHRPTYDRRRASDRLASFIVQSIDSARAVEKPFFHLEFDRVFPDDTYAQILALMPQSADYRPMHGRSKGQDLEDGTHTRVKIDLFPEYIRNLPPEKRAFWDIVGRALMLRSGQASFHSAAGFWIVEAFWRRIRQGRHVSNSDPHPRHSRLSDNATHRHPLEGDHCSALPAKGRCQHGHRYHFP